VAVEHLRTVCNRDCPDACGLIATVEEGRLVRLQGEPSHPVTKGFLCHRTSQFPDRQNSPERITSPLVRKDGALVPASWDEALELIAERLLAIRAESGPAAILHYRSGGSLGLLKSLVDRFFELLGPVSVKRGDICSGAGDAAQVADFGEEDSHDLFDLENSRSILLWGKNPTISNVHLLPLLQKAKGRGARILLVDPIRQKTSRLAERTILVRPGGDFDLAMGAAAVLFASGRIDPGASSYCDHLPRLRALAASRSVEGWAAAADVSPEDVHAVADALTNGPCSIQVGWGMGRRGNGAAIVRALDALGAISGNLGIRGGGVSFYFKRRGAFDQGFLENRPARTLLEPRLGHEILEAKDPAIRAVWVTCGNPVAMLPDSGSVARALETRELVVVVDSFLTDTARRATVVLPTRTLVEDDDLLGAYGHHFISASTPVLEPPPGVLSDLEIVQRLAARIDLSSGAPPIAPHLSGTAREWKERMLGKLAPYGIDIATLERRAARNPLSPKILFEGRRFATASGRVNLVHEAPEPAAPGGDYPLWLFSNSSERSQCSQWVDGEEPDVLTATCHPGAAPSLADGDAVFVESPLGRIRARLAFDPAQRRDVVVVPKGGSFDRGTCANALVPARTTDLGEGAAYLDCRVRLVPA
jgi:anaerobic selenocysteine-containing dehydrogenase